MEWVKILLGPAISVIVLLIGGAVMFGKFKEKCESNDKKIEKAEKGLSERVMHLEENNNITKEECDRRSEMYKTLMCRKIDSLEKAVNKSSDVAEKTRSELAKNIGRNREDVISKFNSINLFIGETRTIMDLLKTKFLEENQ